MSQFYVGDRVLMFAMWSSFYKMKGTVTAVAPHLKVLVDDDKYPLRMGPRECVHLEEPTRPMTAGG